MKNTTLLTLCLLFAAGTQAAPPALPEARCPARVDSALTGPDIVGLKLGMAAADALNAVRCRQPDAALMFQNSWVMGVKTFGLQLERQTVEARSGDTEPCGARSFADGLRCGAGGKVWKFVSEIVYVATPGVPGKETVRGIWRTQRFKDGQMPPADAVLKALSDKYGPPQRVQRPGDGSSHLYWVSDLAGKPLPAGDKRIDGCGGVQARSDSSHRWTEGCGMTIAAQVQPPRNNPQLVQEVHVGMLHQQQTADFVKGFEADLAALDKNRRAQELDKAKSAAAGVKL